jgi:hypothetical protein
MALSAGSRARSILNRYPHGPLAALAADPRIALCLKLGKWCASPASIQFTPEHQANKVPGFSTDRTRIFAYRSADGRRDRFSREKKKPTKQWLSWWTHKGSNLGPLPCEGNALPLSYASGILGGATGADKSAPGRLIRVVRGRDLRSVPGCCQAPRQNSSLWPRNRVLPKPSFIEADQGDLGCPVAIAKIIAFRASPNHLYKHRRLVPPRGAARDRHERGTGCGGR